MYRLLPAREEEKQLSFALSDNDAARYGQIGYLRADFGASGSEFYTTWFDKQQPLKTYDFKNKLNEMIDTLRNEGGEPPFASRKNLDVFCAVVPGADLAGRGDCYMIRTLDYSYYFRCRPSAHDYDVYCVAYDNRYLLPELEAAREPPGEKTAPGIAEKPDGAKERGKGAKPKDYDAR